MTASDYDFDISCRPDFGLLSVRLQAGQSIHAEPAAMASMDSNILMKSSLKGGMWKSLKRGFGGESLVMNTFTAEGDQGEVTFAPGPMGDMTHYHLDGSNTLFMQRGGYVASSPDVTIDSKFQGIGMKTFFGEGMFLLKATGTGDVFFNTYGSLLEIDVTDGYIVDNTYVVAFEETLNYTVETITPKDAGIFKKAKSFLFGGEMFVSRFSGQGKLWIQTRSVSPFVSWVHPFRPTKNDN
jgi:uncharacterized protein (TIGR00266 family)